MDTTPAPLPAAPPSSDVSTPAGPTVLVATFGDPRRATFAVAQARGFSDDVRAYRAHAALPRPQVAGARVIEQVGTLGLATALRDCRDQVLHLHDDVALTPASFAALAAAAERTGQLVTPRTNDLDTDHAFGALPRAMDARKRLAEWDGPATTEVAVRVAPSCLLGAPEHFTALLPFQLPFPGSMLTSVRGDILVANDAVAAHDGAEHDFGGLLPEAPGEVVLVASMIVRDEETLLPGCLAALDGLVDRIDVCDTGSQDTTLAILADHGIAPLHRTWRDDFGWARNEVLDHAGAAAWVLQVDADERVSCPDPALLRRQLRAATTDFDVLHVTLHDASAHATATASWLSQRLLRPDVARFEGALHEQPAARGPRPLRIGALPALRLDHLGYSAAMIDGRDKQNRNLRISRAAYEDAPSLGTALHYARSHELAGEPPEDRIGLYEEVIGLLGPTQARHHAYILGMLATTLLACAEPDLDRASALAAQALEMVPADRIALAAFCRAALTKPEPEAKAVVDMVERCRAEPSLTPLFSDDGHLATIAWLHAGALVQLQAPEDAVRLLVDTIRAGTEGPPVWKLLHDLLAHLDRRGDLDALVVATGSLMGFRMAAEGRPPAAALALAEAFLQHHDAEPVAAFARRAAELAGAPTPSPRPAVSAGVAP